MFTSSLRLKQLTFSMADASQHPLVLALVHTARFRLIQFARTTLALPNAHLRMAVAWHHHKPVATIIATTATPATAWIRCCALDGIHISDHDEVISQLVHMLINARGMTTLYYSSDHYDHWLADILVGAGFTSKGGIVALERPAQRQLPIPTIQAVAQLRPLGVHDIPTMHSIDHLVFAEQWHKIPFEFHELFLEEHYGMLAIRDDCAVGYVLAAIHDFHTALHIVRIAVHPHWQGRGIAKQLLADVIAYAHQSTIQRISLNTQEDNQVAQHLYKQFGFLLTGDRYDIYHLVPPPPPSSDTA